MRQLREPSSDDPRAGAALLQQGHEAFRVEAPVPVVADLFLVPKWYLPQAITTTPKVEPCWVLSSAQTRLYPARTEIASNAFLRSKLEGM